MFCDNLDIRRASPLCVFLDVHLDFPSPKIFFRSLGGDKHKDSVLCEKTEYASQALPFSWMSARSQACCSRNVYSSHESFHGAWGAASTWRFSHRISESMYTVCPGGGIIDEFWGFRLLQRIYYSLPLDNENRTYSILSLGFLYYS
jgi:hypothetical protein